MKGYRIKANAGGVEVSTSLIPFNQQFAEKLDKHENFMTFLNFIYLRLDSSHATFKIDQHNEILLMWIYVFIKITKIL